MKDSHQAVSCEAILLRSDLCIESAIAFRGEICLCTHNSLSVHTKLVRGTRIPERSIEMRSVSLSRLTASYKDALRLLQPVLQTCIFPFFLFYKLFVNLIHARLCGVMIM